MNVKLFALGAFAALVGCSGGFGTAASQSRIVIEFTGKQNLGTRDTRLPLPTLDARPFKVRVHAVNIDGSDDTSFTRYVAVSVKPGAVRGITGPQTQGRNVFLTNGVSQEITVSIQGSFGPTRILGEDLGYVPTDLAKAQCSDGIDNDGDGLIDGADDGCAYPNDDTEQSATFVGGASLPIWFTLPRVADVRGRVVDGNGDEIGGNVTSFPKQQIEIDTGYRETSQSDGSTKPSFAFNTIVTRIASDGFYVTDLNDPRGYGSVFAFNFNAPPGMRVCDRLKSLRGTASDFFGFTEINFPTWTLEEWDPKTDPKTGEPTNPCPVPEPTVLKAIDLQVGGTFVDTNALFKVLAGLVRVESTESTEVRVTRHFGRGDAKCDIIPTFNPVTDLYQYNCTFTDDASNCDLNKDGSVDFSKEPEKSCGAACTADPECTEWSNFVARSAFQLVVHDNNNNINGKIQADATASSVFHPLDLKGQKIRSFGGSLRFFSGGTQFTIEARCKDDIVVDAKSGIPAISKTCVFPRNFVDNNSGSQ